nr:hypothetical protein [Micromonospora matsumotoense]
MPSGRPSSPPGGLPSAELSGGSAPPRAGTSTSGRTPATPAAGTAAPGTRSGWSVPGGYAGPPPTTPPPPGWRPPVHLEATPARTLPAQDMEAMDAAEQRAQRVTWSVGAVIGIVLLLLLCLLCSRALF